MTEMQYDSLKVFAKETVKEIACICERYDLNDDEEAYEGLIDILKEVNGLKVTLELAGIKPAKPV